MTPEQQRKQDMYIQFYRGLLIGAIIGVTAMFIIMNLILTTPDTAGK